MSLADPDAAAPSADHADGKAAPPAFDGRLEPVLRRPGLPQRHFRER